MGKIWVFEGRNGRVWPHAARAAADSRAHGRRAVVYVPEQMTLQTERDLITDLKLKGLLEIEVVSPRKLRLLVKEKTGFEFAGAALYILPALFVYLFFQEDILSGLQLTELK